jgi:hypothetical protein
MRSATRTMTPLSIVLVALAAVLSLRGCADQEAKSKWGPPRDVAGSGEMKPGRGLLTGDSGEWTIFRQ